MVNVNQFIENRPASWFSQDKLITDLNVVNITPDNRQTAPNTYRRVRDQMLSRGMIVGTYISASTVKPAADQAMYPPNSVALEDMPATAHYLKSWPGQPRRKIVDLRDAATRHALQAGIKKLWTEFPSTLRFVDNAGAHPSVSREQDWQATLANIREIRQIAESQGSRAIFNLSLHTAFLSDQDVRDLIDAIGDNGIALEMPWHARVQKSPEDTRKAVRRYRQLLDSGMAVIMIPVGINQRDLADWVVTWRKPADHLYISGVFWKQPDRQTFEAHHLN
jgi:hypothetical protein